MTELQGRLVVLGSTGFVGSQVVRAATEQRWTVVSLSSADVDLCAAGGGLELRAVLQDGDTIVHAAAVVPSRSATDVSSNLRMTQSLVEAASDVAVAQLVVVSSDAVYGSRSGLVREDTPCAPDTLHGVMSLAREMVCAEVLTPVLTVVRPVAIYGGGDTHNSYGPNRFARQMLADGEISVIGAGRSTRDHVAIGDVVDVVVRCIETRQKGVINVASGSSISFADLADLVASEGPARVRISFDGTESSVTFRTYDISALIRRFPDYVPTGPMTGLERMIRGMRKGVVG